MAVSLSNGLATISGVTWFDIYTGTKNVTEILETEFPERTKESMLKTLNAQLGFATGKPARIEIEQKVSLKTERIGKVVFFEIAL